MTKIFKTILLGLYIAVGTFSLSTRAENVTLLLWFEDGGHLDTLTVDRYEVAKVKIGAVSPIPLRAAFIPYKSKVTAANAALEVLEPSDTVTNIIIATHGDTELETNETILHQVGSFGEKGSTGQLKGLFVNLRNKLDPNLGVGLLACSSACGSAQQFSKRVEGLHKELATIGVKTLRVWGARQKLAFHLKNKIEFAGKAEANAKVKSIRRTHYLYSFAGGIVAPTVLALAWYGIDPETFSPLTIGAFSLGSVALQNIIKSFSIKDALDTNTYGYLVEANSEKTKVWSVDADDTHAVLPNLKACETNLVSIP